MTDYKNLKLRASSNPHIRNGEDTRGLMLDVIIALMPALLFGVWHFGVRVAISAVVSVASAIFFEWLYRKLLHKPQMIGDLSAAVTGLLLSMVCPPELPVWMLVVGNFFAIFVVKQLYGGLITVFIRYFGSYPEGVCYSILIMNCCTWIIDKYTKPTRFGVDKKAKKEAAK